jgi:hypothetical protein
MKTLITELKEIIVRRLELASAAEILMIASHLCAAEASPVNPFATIGANTWTNFGTDVSKTVGVDVPPPPRRFVVDHSTGLMWAREDTGANLTWKDAHKVCADLRLGGFSDWRLPTVRELLTLVDYERHSPAIDKDAFPTCKTSWYWTATPLASSPGDYAWFVDFDFGDALCGRQDGEGLVRAVRNV